MVHTCPRCELRFRSEGELTSHLEIDHGVAPGAYDRMRYPTAHQAPLYPHRAEGGRRYLVVANQTLGAAALAQAIKERAKADPAAFHNVVPATLVTDYPARTFASPGPSAASEHPDPGAAQAQWRLERTLAALTSEGLEVTGEVGPPDPYSAISTAFARGAFDEVILSVLPAGMSRWLHADLPARVEQRFRVPTTTIEASA